MKALVIDDSRTIRIVLSRMFGGLGVEVTTAENGREGLDRVMEAADFDVVLVDWNMPIMDGLEFVKNFRSHDKFSETPVLMVTSETELDRMSVALEAGVNEYLMKPFTPEALTDKLAMVGVLVQ